MFLAYRIENQTAKHGIWRNFDGTWNPIFSKLSDGQCKSLPMEDSDLYRVNGKQWFSSAPSKETLKHWFSKQDAIELIDLGYRVYEFELRDAKKVNDFEFIFTRDNIISQREIDYREVYR